MRLCLFREDDYEEVATKVTGALSRWGCWDPGGRCRPRGGQPGRKRLCCHVLAEVFEQVAGQCPTVGRGGRGWRGCGGGGW